MWDTVDQERCRGMTPKYYRGAQATLAVYSVTDPQNFAGVNSWLTSLREHALSDVAVFIVGNKTDMGDKRVVSEADGAAKA